MKHKVTIIPGDGIGPEVSLAAQRCINATGVEIDWHEKIAGQLAKQKTGQLLPDETIESIKQDRVAIKGPIITPIAGGVRSINVAIRKK